MHKKTIAVITTLHASDSIDYARTALQSVFEQHYPRHLIRIYLCVDGALSQEQLEFLESVRPYLHMVIINDLCRGLAYSLNRCLDALTDEDYIFRMDLDDISHADRFVAQVNYMEANFEVDLCGCASDDIDDTGRILSRRMYPQSHAEILRSIAKFNPVLHPTYCIRRNSLARSGLRYPLYDRTEDLGFVVEALIAGWRLANLSDVLFSWRRGRSFYCRRDLKRAMTELRVYCMAIYRLRLGTVAYIYPLLRVCMRMLPTPIVRRLYDGSFRERLGSMTSWAERTSSPDKLSRYQ